MKKIVLAATFAAVAALGVSAQATVIVNSVNGPDDTTGLTILQNFNSGTPAGLSGNGDVKTGTVAGSYAAPLGDETAFLVVPVNGTTGTATYDLGGSYKNLSFYWGSIDDYNTVEFFDANGVSLGSKTGAQIPDAPADGSQGNMLNNRRVFFNFAGDTAASIRFSSSKIAFELDDIATTAVPEPAVWGTMLVGFGFVGATLRRRRNISVAA